MSSMNVNANVVPMMRHTIGKRLFAALAVAIAAVSAACGGDDGGSSEGADSAAKTTAPDAKPAAGGEAKETSSITVKGFQFDPKTASVKAGEPVTWTNKDSSDHSIFDKDGAFKGENFGLDKTSAHTYDKPGTYPYFCGIHNSMTGTINVT